MNPEVCHSRVSFAQKLLQFLAAKLHRESSLEGGFPMKRRDQILKENLDGTNSGMTRLEVYAWTRSEVRA